MNKIEVLQELEQLKNELKFYINFETNRIKNWQTIDSQIEKIINITNEINIDIMDKFGIITYDILENMAINNIRESGLNRLKCMIQNVKNLNTTNYFILDRHGNAKNITRNYVYFIICDIIDTLHNTNI